MKNKIYILVAIAIVFHSVNCLAQPSPIKFTSYHAPFATAEPRSGFRVENIVINKADATDAGFQQLGRQLYALSSGDIATTIGIYTSVWAATFKPDFEHMSEADPLRFSKAWVGNSRKRGNTYTMEYALGGMFKGTEQYGIRRLQDSSIPIKARPFPLQSTLNNHLSPRNAIQHPLWRKPGNLMSLLRPGRRVKPFDCQLLGCSS